ILGLTDIQKDILSIVFKIADENGWFLYDTKDLKAMLNEVAENNKEYAAEYGNITKQSVGAIQRSVVALE
ncbi:helicase HerA-like domain-containing protein, partial [Klebsiella pneumoniae]|uniref:helicase HerA-like domain-containing protein n=1 Tax=Klebsiella pneumoniae TaxID=573 RepID=UPI0025A0E69C